MKNKIILIIANFIVIMSISLSIPEIVEASVTIPSKGSIFNKDTGNTIDGDDITYLENQYENSKLYLAGKRISLKDSLEKIGTYFDNSSIYSHNIINSDSTSIPDFILLSQAVRNSQDMKDSGASGAIAADIAKDKIGLVNGLPIIGTGNNNDTKRADGVLAGKEDGSNYGTGSSFGCDISYIYHKHSGDSVTGGGCYTKPHMVPYQVWTVVGQGYTEREEWHYYKTAHQHDHTGDSSYMVIVRDYYDIYGWKTFYKQEGWDLNCGRTEDVTIDECFIVFN